REGLLSALPVIAGTITISGGGTTGGGGAGGGGGGTTGSGAASDCFSPLVFNSATNTHLEYNVSGSVSGSVVIDTASTPNVSFQGQNLTELRSTTNTSYTAQPVVLTTLKTYGTVDGTDILQYGSIAEFSSPVAGSSTSVFSPPSRDKRFSLAVGQS